MLYIRFFREILDNQPSSTWMHHVLTIMIPGIWSGCLDPLRLRELPKNSCVMKNIRIVHTNIAVYSFLWDEFSTQQNEKGTIRKLYQSAFRWHIEIRPWPPQRPKLRKKKGSSLNGSGAKAVWIGVQTQSLSSKFFYKSFLSAKIQDFLWFYFQLCQLNAHWGKNMQLFQKIIFRKKYNFSTKFIFSSLILHKIHNFNV